MKRFSIIYLVQILHSITVTRHNYTGVYLLLFLMGIRIHVSYSTCTNTFPVSTMASYLSYKQRTSRLQFRIVHINFTYDAYLQLRSNLLCILHVTTYSIRHVLYMWYTHSHYVATGQFYMTYYVCVTYYTLYNTCCYTVAVLRALRCVLTPGCGNKYVMYTMYSIHVNDVNKYTDDKNTYVVICIRM